mmetsp:Transcript_20668/g.58863  ORF Transcript_20668/g.58863 Transcript_20668/m.58863 type:complete len:200 (-) Transcript_20668:119-718(-)
MSSSASSFSWLPPLSAGVGVVEGTCADCCCCCGTGGVAGVDDAAVVVVDDAAVVVVATVAVPPAGGGFFNRNGVLAPPPDDDATADAAAFFFTIVDFFLLPNVMCNFSPSFSVGTTFAAALSIIFFASVSLCMDLWKPCRDCSKSNAVSRSRNPNPMNAVRPCFDGSFDASCVTKYLDESATDSTDALCMYLANANILV